MMKVFDVRAPIPQPSKVELDSVFSREPYQVTPKALLSFLFVFLFLLGTPPTWKLKEGTKKQYQAFLCVNGQP